MARKSVSKRFPLCLHTYLLTPSGSCVYVCTAKLVNNFKKSNSFAKFIQKNFPPQIDTLLKPLLSHPTAQSRIPSGIGAAKQCGSKFAIQSTLLRKLLCIANLLAAWKGVRLLLWWCGSDAGLPRSPPDGPTTAPATITHL